MSHDHSPPPPPNPGGAEPGPTFGGHGQLIVGQETIYLSHLPMFMFDPKEHPHNFQVILEVTFTGQGSDPSATYVRDRRDHPEQPVYTFSPEPFEMTDLVSTDPTRRRESFAGTVFRGHFERPGRRAIAEGVTASVKRVVYFQEFDPKAEARAQAEYILFGKGDERFLAHVITRPPDFDQVLAVRAVHGHDFSDDELARGARVVFPSRPNTLEGRLQPEATMRGDLVVGEEPNVQRTHLEVEVGPEFYLESRELAEAMMPQPG
jgi:hypothetical protein